VKATREFSWGTEVSVGGHMSETENRDTGDYYRGAVDVEFTQPLFRNFGPLIHEEGIVRANSALRTARRGYEQQKAGLVVQVAEAFVSITRLRRQIASDEELLQRTEKLHRLTRAREAQGRATRVDALRVDLQLGEARLRLANSKESLSTTQRLFAELLGVAPDRTFEMDVPPLLTITIPSAEEAVRTALKNRLDYAQALQDGRESERAVRIARRALYPDIALKASFEKFGEGDNASEGSKLNDDTWFLGLAASTDLNRSQDRLGLDKAIVNEDSARGVIKIKEVSIAREVKERMDAYRRAQTSLKIAERNLTLAEGRTKLARRLFEAGRGDNFSVTDAEDALVQAQSGLLGAKAEALLSGYRLLQALGTLTEFPEELKPEHANREN
jgi:outer membrane protein TolC